MTRPSLSQALAAKMAKATDPQNDPAVLDRVLKLAQTNPTAYAELPEGVRRSAAMHGIKATGDNGSDAA